MHLFLIRHGETEHNVAGLLAGVTDSRLTNHGVLQAQRLGKHLTNSRGLKFTHFYASDLQRAWMTAEEIRKAQISQHGSTSIASDVVKLELLREQDFGSYEMVPWASASKANAYMTQVPDPGDDTFQPRETSEAMQARSESFWDDFILPLLAVGEDEGELSVAVVSHGMFLNQLWRTFLSKFDVKNVSLGPDTGPSAVGKPLEYLTAWGNTGFLELSIHPLRPKSTEATAAEAQVVVEDVGVPFSWSTSSMKVLMVNGKDHLQDLKRTRGGVGSAPYDTKQKPIGAFFKKRKTDESEELDELDELSDC